MPDDETSKDTDAVIEDVEVRDTSAFASGILSALEVIHHSVANRETRLMAKAMRRLPQLRTTIRLGVIASLLASLDDGSRLLAALQGVHKDVEKCPPELAVVLPTHKFSNSKCEVCYYLGVLTTMHLIKSGNHHEARDFCAALIEISKSFSRRTLDSILGKIYYYYSWTSELCGTLNETKPLLMEGYRTAALHRDLMTQAVTMNSLLRCHILNSDHDLALKLVSKGTFPPNLRSNAQHSRYLYYVGCLQAAQLEYSTAFSCLQRASRKAPQAGDSKNRGRGFRNSINKMLILVQLLMGDTPPRALFNDAGKVSLLPYKKIVLAVRSGNLSKFADAMQQNTAVFEADHTAAFVDRLRHCVMRAALRTISLSYSLISLDDVAKLLGLPSARDAAGVVSKATLDGVVEAVIEDGNLRQQPSQLQPRNAMHLFGKRTAFCLQLHNDAVKAMHFPSEETEDAAHKAKEAEERRKEQQEQLARAEEDDYSDEMDMI